MTFRILNKAAARPRRPLQTRVALLTNNQLLVVEPTLGGEKHMNRHPSDQVSNAEVRAVLKAFDHRSSSDNAREYSRADILKKGLVLGGAVALGGSLASDALATGSRVFVTRRAEVDTSTVRVAAAGPVLGLDVDNAANNTYVPSLQAIFACYDPLVYFAMYTSLEAANRASRASRTRKAGPRGPSSPAREHR